MKLVKKPVNRSAKSKQQHLKNKKKGKPSKIRGEMTNAERALWADMDQIDWFPMDPYGD